MIPVKEIIHKNYKIKTNIKINFQNKLSDKEFMEFCNKINLSEEILCKYASRLDDSFKELKSCQNCKGIGMCQNEMKGYLLSPIVNNNNIIFSYMPCHYKEKELEDTSYQKNIKLFEEPIALKNARMKDIYLDDKARIKIIKYLNEYIKDYKNNRKKGLYLTGNFGCGKTYLISAMFNELAKQNILSAIIYFPEFLRTLKSSFNDSDGITYSERFDYIKHIPLLLIDDIGAENLTTWARDEVLGTILQYRMQENLATFFTSNLNLEELEIHMAISSGKVDKVKARRIIERIKYLADEEKLIGLDRRK